MSKAFITGLLKTEAELTSVAANRLTKTLLEGIVKQLKLDGKFTLPGFGTFKVNKIKAHKALNPRTGEPIKVKAGKTVRFKASPVLKKSV